MTSDPTRLARLRTRNGHRPNLTPIDYLLPWTLFMPGLLFSFSSIVAESHRVEPWLFGCCLTHQSTVHLFPCQLCQSPRLVGSRVWFQRRFPLQAAAGPLFRRHLSAPAPPPPAPLSACLLLASSTCNHGHPAANQQQRPPATLAEGPAGRVLLPPNSPRGTCEPWKREA